MKEIRIHGRGGQGSLVLAQSIAMAALEEGKFSQAFPFLGGGGERRGKPIQAFVRIDDRFIRLRCRVHEPDYVIVQDSTILDEVNVMEGVKAQGTIIVNSAKPLSSLHKKISVRWIEVPATKIAVDTIGKPLMNAALLGAFCALTKELSFSSVEKAIRKRFPGETGNQNAEIVRTAFERYWGEQHRKKEI